MDENEKLIQEATRLALLMVAGEASSEEAARLDDLVLTHPQVASLVVEIVGQENWLAWSSKVPIDSTTKGSETPRLRGMSGKAEKTIYVSPERAGNFSSRPHSLISWSLAAACILLIVGGLGGAYLTGGIGNRTLRSEAIPPVEYVTTFSGRVLNPSSCRWSPGTIHQALDGELHQGESLNLLEGVAEVRLNWPIGNAKLAIEGPAGVVLTSRGGCNLSNGRMTADVSTNGSAFRVDAPNCQVIVTQEAVLGVLVDGHDVEVHAFQGQASVVVPWSSEDRATQYFDILEGESLTIDEDPEGNLLVRNGESNLEKFVSSTSMRSDKLVIPAAYVRNVQSLAPLLYWRFDGTADQRLASSVQPDISAQVYGEVKFQQDAGNQYVDIGADSSAKDLMAYLVSSQPLDADFGQGYSLEMWFKPRHYHRGVLASMIPLVLPEVQASAHGMLLELGGPRALKPALEKAGKIRFLHRSPPSSDITEGTSCFSESNYALRRWQHIVSVKDSGQIRLYVDGILSSVASDETQLTSGLRLLLGKIDDVRKYRQFAGQLDEVAFYSRPLSLEEILHHYRLVRPKDDGETLQAPPSI